MPHIALLHAEEDHALIEHLRQGLQAQDFMVETVPLPANPACHSVRDTLLMADWPVLLAGPSLDQVSGDQRLAQLPVPLRDLLVLHWQRPAPEIPGVAALDLEWPTHCLMLAVRKLAVETGRHAGPVLLTVWLMLTALSALPMTE